jgi:hypothetical protein
MQIAMIAGRLADLSTRGTDSNQTGGNRANVRNFSTQDQAAEAVGVSRRSVQYAREVLGLRNEGWRFDPVRARQRLKLAF